MTCPNCHAESPRKQRLRWRMVRPIFPVKLLAVDQTLMPRGMEHRFKCPNCNGFFYFTETEVKAAKPPVTKLNFILNTHEQT